MQACDFDIIHQAAPVKSGSTAVVVLIRKGKEVEEQVSPFGSESDSDSDQAEDDSATMLYCANVGDSKAVLCRGGHAVELSYDHKPSRPDEKERIIAAGGTVVTGRLFGVLGVSRSFGDARFKPIMVRSCDAKILVFLLPCLTVLCAGLRRASPADRTA